MGGYDTERLSEDNSEGRKWYPFQRLNSTSHSLSEFLSTPALEHPALTWAFEPIPVVTIPRVAETLNSVSDEMTWGQFHNAELVGCRQCQSHPHGSQYQFWRARKPMDSPGSFI